MLLLWSRDCSFAGFLPLLEPPLTVRRPASVFLNVHSLVRALNTQTVVSNRTPPVSSERPPRSRTLARLRPQSERARGAPSAGVAQWLGVGRCTQSAALGGYPGYPLPLPGLWCWVYTVCFCCISISSTRVILLFRSFFVSTGSIPTAQQSEVKGRVLLVRALFLCRSGNVGLSSPLRHPLSLLHFAHTCLRFAVFTLMCPVDTAVQTSRPCPGG